MSSSPRSKGSDTPEALTVEGLIDFVPEGSETKGFKDVPLGPYFCPKRDTTRTEVLGKSPMLRIACCNCQFCNIDHTGIAYVEVRTWCSLDSTSFARRVTKNFASWRRPQKPSLKSLLPNAGMLPVLYGGVDYDPYDAEAGCRHRGALYKFLVYSGPIEKEMAPLWQQLLVNRDKKGALGNCSASMAITVPGISQGSPKANRREDLELFVEHKIREINKLPDPAEPHESVSDSQWFGDVVRLRRLVHESFTEEE